MRGGVPVFRRRVGKPSRRSAGASPIGRGLAEAALGAHDVAAEGLPPKKRSGREYDAARASSARRRRMRRPRTAPALDDEIVDQARHDREIRLRAQLGDRRPRVGRLVHLLAKRAYRRPLLSLKNARGGCSGRRARHRSAQGVDLSNELPFCAAADRRVAGQRANFLGFPGNQQRGNAEARRSEGGFDAGMTAADDDRAGIVAHGYAVTAPPASARAPAGVAKSRS